jgi:pantetheine-phosphate adenylyltransferase
MRAIYPGSFDPLTLGHLDIIQRASKIFGEVLVLISENPDKSGHITIADRIKLIKEATKDLTNIKVSSHLGLTVDYARDHKYHVLVRGIRAASDFETELEMSQINHSLSEGLETVFLMTSPQYSFIRASRVWELVKFGGNLELLVPDNVKTYLLEKALH